MPGGGVETGGGGAQLTTSEETKKCQGGRLPSALDTTVLVIEHLYPPLRTGRERSRVRVASLDEEELARPDCKVEHQ